MALRLIQFLAIILTALALVPSGARLAALPNKMAMAQAADFVAQKIYAGWALFGVFLFGALAANLVQTIVLRRLGRSFGYALASFLLIAANLAIFFVWTFPTNQATNNWTVVPKNWSAFRIQWELFARCQRRRDGCGLGLCGYCGASTAFASEIRVTECWWQFIEHQLAHHGLLPRLWLR